MKKYYIFVCLICMMLTVACSSSKNNNSTEINNNSTISSESTVVDSVYYSVDLNRNASDTSRILLYSKYYLIHIIGDEGKFAVDIIKNGNINSLSTVIKKERISECDKYTLRLLRNTIYAKCGLLFKSVDMQLHFSKFKLKIC